MAHPVARTADVLTAQGRRRRQTAARSAAACPTLEPSGSTHQLPQIDLETDRLAELVEELCNPAERTGAWASSRHAGRGYKPDRSVAITTSRRSRSGRTPPNSRFARRSAGPSRSRETATVAWKCSSSTAASQRTCSRHREAVVLGSPVITDQHGVRSRPRSRCDCGGRLARWSRPRLVRRSLDERHGRNAADLSPVALLSKTPTLLLITLQPTAHYFVLLQAIRQSPDWGLPEAHSPRTPRR